MIATHVFGDITLLIAPIDRHEGDNRPDAERRAVSRLISYAFGPSACLAHRPSGAPYIIGSDVSVSVSHSRGYAAVAYSSAAIVGVDIEEPRQQLARVAPRVFSDEELALYSSPELLLRAWTLKEALYKAALTPGLDFRKDIRLPLPPDATLATVENRPYSVISIITEPSFTLSLVSQTNKLS